MRRAWQLASMAVLVGLSSCSGPRWDRNVVLIVIDTLRAEGLPLYGGPESTAPFLASLAQEGLVFEQAWSASSWTAPAMASIFTSTYPDEHGVIVGLRVHAARKHEVQDIRVNRIPERMDTIPTFLHDRGYATFGVSGNLNVDEAMGFSRGFDRFEMIDYHEDEDALSLVSALLGWRSEIETASPFFLYLHFMDPHGPYRRHAEWVPEDAPPPLPVVSLEDRVAYNSEIRMVDEQIRRLFRELPLSEALVIVTSDHGQEFGDHGSFGHGFQLYSELTRVPLLVRHPEGPAGRVARGVSNLDVLPTLRALLGAPASPQDRGLPLWGAGAAGGADERPFFSMRSRIRRDETTNKRAVVQAGRKLIVTEPQGEVELYDLAVDPGERRDLSSERPEEVRALRALLDEQGRRGSASRFEAADPVRADLELIKMLERLGYVEEDAP